MHRMAASTIFLGNCRALTVWAIQWGFDLPGITDVPFNK